MLGFSLFIDIIDYFNAPKGPRMHVKSPPLRGCTAAGRAPRPQQETDRHNHPTRKLKVLPHRFDLAAGFGPTAPPGVEQYTGYQESQPNADDQVAGS